MARINYSLNTLRAHVDDCNERLKQAGSRIRFREQGRNGYQAVDEYSVDEHGDRIGSGVNRNVGCGTSREVGTYVSEAFYAELDRIDRESKASK